MQASKRARIIPVLAVGAALNHFAFSQVKTDTLLPQRDSAFVVKEDSIKVRAELKKETVRLELKGSRLSITCPAPDGKMIDKMIIDIEPELAEIGVKPDSLLKIGEKSLFIKDGRIYLLFEGKEKALILIPKAGGDVHVKVGKPPS
ncbi:MAG: hypothetical protein N3G22_01595 [Candidatus Micrarchaeota archaeon]|nr:hypothetical protein [Candidatus Micrarchaeota archaeon]